MAPQSADPAFVRNDYCHRLAYDHSLFDRSFVVRRCDTEGRSTLSDGGFWAESLFQLFDLGCNCFPLLRGRPNQRLELGTLFTQCLVFRADFHFLKLAQIAQPHVEDGIGLNIAQLEGFHQDGLGLVLFANNLDYLVEVEIGDQIAAEHLQAMFDFGQAVFRAPQQHFAPVIEPFAQSFGKTKHLRNSAFHQHVHIEGNSAFELGELEKRLHHQFGVNRT